jgi:hypothetical protein
MTAFPIRIDLISMMIRRIATAVLKE